MNEPVSPAVELDHRLTAQDASFLYAESRNGFTHVGSIAIYEGHLSIDELVRHIENRLHFIPRYRQRLAEVPFNLNHPTWEDDPDFRIENHVRRHVLPSGASDEDLLAAANAVNEPMLDRSRPLWEMHTFEGLSGNRTGVLWRIHHALIDGMSGVELSTVAMDFEPNPPAPPRPTGEWKPKALPSLFKRTLDAALDLVQTQTEYLRRLAEVMLDPDEALNRAKLLTEAFLSTIRMARPLAPVPWSNRLVTSRRALAYSVVPLAEIKAVRTALGGTLNDVVLTMLSEGAARYLRSHDYEAGGRYFRIGCPVSVRRPDEKSALGNRVSMMFPEVPAYPMDPVERLQVVNAETERIKASGAPQGMELMMEAADLMMPSLIGYPSRFAMAAYDAAVEGSKLLPIAVPNPRFAPAGFGMSFLATNVPGVPVTQYLAGHKLLDSIGVVPLGGNIGYGVAIMSYNQKLYFGMMSDPNNMPDVDLMKSHVDQVFAELKQAAARKTEAAVEHRAAA